MYIRRLSKLQFHFAVNSLKLVVLKSTFIIIKLLYSLDMPFLNRQMLIDISEIYYFSFSPPP